MNWKEKLETVISETLNADGDGAFRAKIIDDNSFEVLRYGDQILKTECLEFYLPSHWKTFARTAVLRVVEDEFNRQLSLLEK